MDLMAIYMILVVLALLMLAPFIIELLRMKLDSKPSMFDIIRVRQSKEPLRRLLAQTRLADMLAYLGFTQDEYLMNVPEGEIKTHVARCKACPDTIACDSCLHEQGINCDLRFCPNARSLLGYGGTNPATG